jgi:hypothetical protein
MNNRKQLKQSVETNTVHSRIVSLKYTPSFYEDYVAIQKILLAQPSTEPRPVVTRKEIPKTGVSQYPPLAIRRRPRFAQRLVIGRRATVPEKKIKLSSGARRRLHQLLHRIGLTKCKCLVPRIRQIESGYFVKGKRIPIFELHCPKVRSSEASYLESKTRSGDFRITLSLLGTGADFGVAFEEKTSDGISVRDGTCCRIVRETRIIARKVSYVCDKCKSTTATKFLFSLAPGSDELIPVTIDRSEDGCNQPVKKLRPEEYMTIPVPKNVRKRKSVTISSGTKSQASFGISVAGLKLRGTIAVETLGDIQHEYVLLGPRTYYYYPAKGLNKFWATAKYEKSQVSESGMRSVPRVAWIG